VLKHLGSKSDTTFENAWDGITFTRANRHSCQPQECSG
jgi:hypothetical protein